jgi:hypothetical protein
VRLERGLREQLNEATSLSGKAARELSRPLHAAAAVDEVSAISVSSRLGELAGDEGAEGWVLLPGKQGGRREARRMSAPDQACRGQPMMVVEHVVNELRR